MDTPVPQPRPPRGRRAHDRLRIAATLLGCCAAGALNAGETGAELHVVITVPAVARLQVLAQAPSLEVTAADLLRGYVEVNEPTHLRVYSNAREGFALDVLPMSALVQSVAVRGMGAEALLGASGGSIVQRWQRPQTADLRLTFRLGLAQGTSPGIYAWPLHLSAEPLATGR